MTLPARAVATATLLRFQEGAAVARRDQLGGRLAGAVGIVAAEGIVLAVRIRPLVVAIDLVGRDDDGDADVVEIAQRVEQMRRAHRVGREGRERVAVARPHQRLRREMEDDLRPRRAHRGGGRGGVAQVDDPAGEHSVEVGEPVQALVRGGEREPGDVGAEPLQPERQPRALEAGVAGEEDALAAPECRAAGAAHQRFQGARPDCHSSSSRFLSRSVSIGCQKPSWT